MKRLRRRRLRMQRWARTGEPIQNVPRSELLDVAEDRRAPFSLRDLARAELGRRNAIAAAARPSR